MIKNPYSQKEFRDAIVSSLSPGEQLHSFEDCLQVLYGSDEWGNPFVGGAQWLFLALTNINIRQGGWIFDSHKTGWFKPTTFSARPEIEHTSMVPIGDIVSITHTKSPVHFNVSAGISARLGEAYWPRNSSLECAFLTLSFSNSTSIDVLSPFVEFEELIKNISAAKSGALVVQNTMAAADALDQLVPLLNDGILTQEEFDRAKEGFLGATVEVRESSVSLLRQLHSLHKSGVLTESEFNLKKWDILSKDE